MNIKQAILKAVQRERTRLFKSGKSECIMDVADRFVQIVERTKIKTETKRKGEQWS